MIRVHHLPRLVALGALAFGIVAAELGVRDAAPPGVVLPVPGAVVPAVEALRSVPLVAIEDPRAAAVASGVVFGRTTHVAAAQEQAFLASGLWHLLAASGQNVALVAGCCLLLARACGAGRTTGVWLALVAIPAYVLVVGGGASIVRAGAMAELALVAWLAGRLPDPRQLLLVAAAAISIGWPGAHRSLGMQLSFACVAALAWQVVPLTRALRDRGVPDALAGATAATLLCSAATAPILQLRTGAAPLTGIAANLVAVPLAAAILVLGLAGSIVASLARGIGLDVGELLLWPAGQLAGLLVGVAHRAAAAPAAQTAAPLLAIGLPCCVLLLLTQRGRRPRARRALVVVAIGCVVVSSLGSLVRAGPAAQLLAGRLAPPDDGELRIGVLDVGQGDATLLAAAGEAVLVDTGPPEGRVVDRVRELGVREVDGIVLTHDSLDHRGGFEAAVAALDPEWVAMPRAAPGPWQRVRSLAPRIVELCAGSSFRVGDAEVEVLHPRCDGTIAPRTGDLHNDGAMVLLVRHGEIRALLPADAEAPVLLGLGLPRLDLLRVAHHGSSDPGLDTLLARVAPQVAAISVGAGNEYGHPHPQALGSLRRAGASTLRTDEDGTIALDSDGRVLRRAR